MRGSVSDSQLLIFASSEAGIAPAFKPVLALGDIEESALLKSSAADCGAGATPIEIQTEPQRIRRLLN